MHKVHFLKRVHRSLQTPRSYNLANARVMSAPANQSTLARTNQLEPLPFRVNPFEQLGSGHRVLHKKSLDFVPSSLGIFANNKTDQIRNILIVPRRLSKHKVIPQDPYTPEGDSTNKEPETCHRLKFARNRAGKQHLGPVREGPLLSTAALRGSARRLRRFVEKVHSCWESSQLQKRWRTVSSSFVEHMGQHLSTWFEIFPRHTLTATALCHNCQMSMASLRALSLVHASPHANWNLGGKIRFHLVAAKSGVL
jgi:hypothetical protein